MSPSATDQAIRLFEVLEHGNPALATLLVDPEFFNHEAAVAPAACAIPGPAGVLASSAWMRSAFSDLRFPIVATAANEEQVWVRLRMRGRHTGPFIRYRDGVLDQAVPPTGRDIDFEQIHVLTLRSARVVRHEAVRDDMTMLAQLGVFPPNPGVGARMLAWKVTGRAARAAARVSRIAEEAASVLIPALPSPHSASTSASVPDPGTVRWSERS